MALGIWHWHGVSWGSICSKIFSRDIAGHRRRERLWHFASGIWGFWTFRMDIDDSICGEKLLEDCALTERHRFLSDCLRHWMVCLPRSVSICIQRDGELPEFCDQCVSLASHWILISASNTPARQQRRARTRRACRDEPEANHCPKRCSGSRTRLGRI
jgi:hypothetical protein